MKRIPAALFITVLCLATRAQAGALSWDVTRIKAVAKPGQSEVTVSYPFRNTGNAPVTIVSVEPSCRCVAAQGDRKTYAPGEKGTIDAAFTVGGQTGVAEKSILVTTDEIHAQPVELDLEVDIAGP